MSNDSEKEVKELFSQLDKGVGSTKGVGGVLARLWRTIVRDLNIPLGQFEIHLTQFVNNARRGIDSSKVANYFNRGNLRRELVKPSMTFKVFIKALKVLNVERFDLSIKIYKKNGTSSVHQTSVDISGGFDFDDAED